MNMTVPSITPGRSCIKVPSPPQLDIVCQGIGNGKMKALIPILAEKWNPYLYLLEADRETTFLGLG